MKVWEFSGRPITKALQAERLPTFEERIEARHQARLRRLAWRDRLNVCPTWAAETGNRDSGAHEMSYTIEQLDCAVKSATEQLARDRDLWRERHDRERAAHAKNLTEQQKVEAERDRLRDVLERLVDYQNGCPLPSYEKEWTRAMDDAAILLGRSAQQRSGESE